MNATAKFYWTQFTNQAGELYKEARDYVTAKPANTTAPYQWQLADGSLVNLTGPGRQFAIQHSNVQNQEAQYRNISKVVMTVLASTIHYCGYGANSFLSSFVVLPAALFFLHREVNKAISSHFKVETDRLKQEISGSLATL